jgi:two-component system, cell cycle response regulator DivK
MTPPARTDTAPLVLIVDDYQDAREMYAEYLEFSGFRVAEARNGAEAVEKAFALHPAVILMDLSLPVMDGWEATRCLKGAPETRAIPVIALTAHAMQGDRDTTLAAGCDEYDIKPIDLDRLLGKIDALLARGRSS